MLRSTVARWALGLLVVMAVLALVRFKPWQRPAGPGAGGATAEARERLNVGFLPVT